MTDTIAVVREGREPKPEGGASSPHIEVMRHAPEPEPSNKKKREDPAPTLAVWTARVLSLGAIGFIVGYLLYCIVTDGDQAQFVFEPDFDTVEQRNGSYVLHVSVINDSTEAVTSVGVTARLDLPGEERDEEIALTIALMGEGETAEAELLFDARPTENNTEFRVTSYQSP